MDISTIKQKSVAAEKGHWVGDLPGMEGLRLKVRGNLSPTVTKFRSEQEADVAKTTAINGKDAKIDFNAIEKVVNTVMVEVVLLDWSGLTEDEKEIPYSKELATTLLTDPEYFQFANAVSIASGRVDAGLIKFGDETVKKPVAT